MDLGDIIDELRAERPSLDISGGMADPLEKPIKWTAEDKVQNLTLILSKYEAHWLMWRLKVHLRSYEALEWSEMKEVLECLVMRIQSLSTSTNLCTDNSFIPVTESSELTCTPTEELLPSDAEDATRL